VLFGFELGGFPDHGALMVTLPKGNGLGFVDWKPFLKFGLDDAIIGQIGNTQHIFGLSDISDSYMPPGYYDAHPWGH
jgi:hypothetical protein